MFVDTKILYQNVVLCDTHNISRGTIRISLLKRSADCQAGLTQGKKILKN